MIETATPVRYLKGVGEQRAAILEASGFPTALELCYHFPLRFEDRRVVIHIADLKNINEPVTLRGEILSIGLKSSPMKRMKIVEATIADATGKVTLVWFNQGWVADQLQRGDRIILHGQAKWSRQGRLQFENPSYEKLDLVGEGDTEGSIVSIYPAIATLPPKIVRRIVAAALPAIASLRDPLPDALRLRMGVPTLADAVLGIHAPADLDELFLTRRSPSHLRLILGEFFFFQLLLQSRRAAEEQAPKERTVIIDDRVRESVRRILPFKLTGAQRRVMREIADDLRSDRPMYRMLQGDVGSGKTIVAIVVGLVVVENGQQVALLAPTEILVEQHTLRLRAVLGDSARVESLSAGMGAAARRKIIEELARGEIDIIVGTHALLEDEVRFRNLGLAIVDEQHRFGVEQRRRLFAKGGAPDILLMTATPIPRSLALSVFGDLDLSVIDEAPPGRIPIRTIVRGAAQLPKVFDMVRRELAEGAQAYVVFPLIEQSETMDLTPLEEGIDLVRELLPDSRCEMIHGRMPGEDKRRIMAAFKDRKSDVLVSTTVIEVGIDVPSATMMVILDADRYGLSQLHQLRGRVGRGERASTCILVRSETASEEAKERLRMFEGTANGFDVAERDLEMRGAGDLLGLRQAGESPLRFGNVLRDADLMERARDLAIEFVREKGPAAAATLLKRAERTLGHAPRD